VRVPRSARLLALAGYTLVILWATLHGLHPEADLGKAVLRLGRAVHPSPSARDVIDAARNLVLFAGLGALWVVVTPTTTLRRTVATPLVIGATISGFVESLQLFSPVRAASILDILTNTVGAGMGAGAIVTLAAVAARLKTRKSFVGVPAVVFLGGYAVAALLEAVILVRQEPVLGAVGGPVARIAAVLASADFGTFGPILLGDVLLFLPLGLMAVATDVEFGHGYSAAFRRAAVAGVLFAIVGELVRAPLGLPVQLGPILTHAFAMVAGAWLGAWGLPRLTPRIRGRERARLAALGYAALMALWAWRPYVPETRLEAILAQLDPVRWIPLAALAPRFDLFSVADVVSPFFLYLPLGAFLSGWPARRAGPVGGCLAGVYLAAVTELGQVFVAGRYFSGTDVMIQTAAVAIGWTVMRRVGYRPYGALVTEGRRGAGESRRRKTA